MNEMRRNAKKRPAVKKVFALLLALSMFCALLAGCDKKEETDNVTVRVGAMSGPTAMGMVKLMKECRGWQRRRMRMNLQSFRRSVDLCGTAYKGRYRHCSGSIESGFCDL